MNTKKSQVTIFLILGIVLIIIVTMLILVGRQTVKKTSRQETIDAQEASFDIQPINNFVTECLSIVSKDGLKKIGNQGGYLFTSQGGTLIDYRDTDEGKFFVNYENSRVVYNIFKPRFPLLHYFPDIPSYPWKTFPYTDATMTTEIFEVQDIFGVNTMPPLNRSFGSHSMKTQLETFIEKNIDACLDFSVFKDFNFTKQESEVEVDLNENDVTIKMEYPIIIRNLVSGETTQLKDFLVKHEVRLGKLHKFVNQLIERDISDINFSISDGSKDNFRVDIINDVFNNDDLIIITDRESFLDNSFYKYSFSRKNRNPAIYYLAPETITLPKFEPGTFNFTIITNDTLITNYPEDLKALDPDEDIIELNDFSITPDTPKTIGCLTPFDFKVEVTDGELTDYQDITVIIEGC